MNIKRVPCLAVVVRGPQRDRIIEVIELDLQETSYWGETCWRARSRTPMKLPGIRGSVEKYVDEFVAKDAALRPIDDPGEPEVIHKPQEMTA